MTRTQAELFALLERLEIHTQTVEHPALYTVEQSRALRGTIAGAHTKNLFIKDKKSRYFLVTCDEDAEIDLKTIHQAIGASGRVSFGSPDRLLEYLGVLPGSVTVFGLINDHGGAVTMVFDERLLASEIINAHPLTNEATTSIGRDDLLRFVRETGHEPLTLNLTGQ